MTDRGLTITAVLVMAGTLVAGGCASQARTGAASGAGARPLTSNQAWVFQVDEWHLIRMVERGVEVPLMANAAVSLVFLAPDRVGGAASVNRYSGSFDLGPDGRITWKGSFATTRMAGRPELMTQESRYLQLLGKTTRARTDGPRLILDDGSPSTVLEFSPGR